MISTYFDSYIHKVPPAGLTNLGKLLYLCVQFLLLTEQRTGIDPQDYCGIK